MTTEHLLKLLDRLGNPQNTLQVIHVAGTNGKGSVCAIMEGVCLQIPDYKIGRFSSPSPVDDKNGITINGKRISDQDYDTCMSKVHQATLEMATDGLEVPSEFECLVAAVVLYFVMHQVQAAIIEVGMGGLNDATNVFDHPLLSIITGIDYDHTDFLGNTLTDIATHKAGIIKPKCPVVIGDLPKEAMSVIFKQCAKKNAPLLNPFKNRLAFTRQIQQNMLGASNDNLHPYHQAITFENAEITYHLSLLGAHQVNNLLIALTALNALETCIPELRPYIQTAGQIIWPCRQELMVYDHKLLMFDGAHNPQSMAALCDTISTDFSQHSTAVLFSVFSDKDMDFMLKKLSTISGKLIITHMNHERGASCDQIQTIANTYFKDITVINDPVQAFEYLQNQPESLKLITGSLYLTVPLRNRIVPVMSSVY